MDLIILEYITSKGKDIDMEIEMQEEEVDSEADLDKERDFRNYQMLKYVNGCYLISGNSKIKTFCLLNNSCVKNK